jgi:hypothetical protein
MGLARSSAPRVSIVRAKTRFPMGSGVFVLKPFRHQYKRVSVSASNTCSPASFSRITRRLT